MFSSKYKRMFPLYFFLIFRQLAVYEYRGEYKQMGSIWVYFRFVFSVILLLFGLTIPSGMLFKNAVKFCVCFVLFAFFMVSEFWVFVRIIEFYTFFEDLT